MMNKKKTNKSERFLGKNGKSFLAEVRAKRYRPRLVPMDTLRKSVFTLVDGESRDDPEALIDALVALNGKTVWYSFITADDEVIHLPVRYITCMRQGLGERLCDAEYAVVIQGINRRPED